MTSNETLTGRFVLGINLYRTPDNQTRTEFQSVFQDIPIELVIMQLRAFVRSLDSGYFSNFKHSIHPTPKDD